MNICWPFFMVFSMVIIMDSYVAKIIPKSLNVTRGIVSQQFVGRDSFIKLTNAEGEALFTCGLGIQSGGRQCTSKDTRQVLERAEGKAAVVEWYPQSFIPTNRQKKLVSFSVEGEYVITRSMTESGSHSAFGVVLNIYSVVIGISTFLFLRGILKKYREKNHVASTRSRTSIK